MRSRAITLIEVLVCIAIIAVIAGISYPVFSHAKKSSQETVTKSNLRQMWQLVNLYREDWNPADVGNLYRLGLPPADVYEKEFHPKLTPPLAGRYRGFGWYYYLPPDPKYVFPDMVDRWEKTSNVCSTDIAIIADFNFSDVHIIDSSPLLTRRAIGIRLNGRLSDRKGTGMPIEAAWWGCSR